jgi:hypothetical protein
MFEHLEMRDKAMIYQGLVCLVKSNSGVGFCNGDQGHPAYAVGKDGKIDFEAFGDSPEQNRLFKMMHELTVALGEADLDASAEVSERIYCWADFCRLAFEAYERHRRPST